MKRGYKNIIIFIKILSLSAFFCTIILGIGLITASLIPGDKSGSVTSAVTSKIDGVIDVSSKLGDLNATEALTINRDNLRKDYYAGETFTPVIDFVPKTASDRSLKFSVSNADVAKVTDSGIVFLKKGTVKLTVSLRSDESVYDETMLNCLGEDVLDPDHPERLDFSFGSSSTARKAVGVCEEKTVILNKGKTSERAVSYSVDRPDVLGVYEGKFFGRKVGVATVTVSTLDGAETLTQFTVNVTDTGKTPVARFDLTDDITFVHGETLEDLRTLFIKEDGKLADDYECIAKSDDENVVAVDGRRLLFRNPGKVKIKFTSAYNPSLETEKTFEVTFVKPDFAKVLGSNVIMPNEKQQYVFKQYPKNYSDCVRWEVVKGNATISDSGVLVAKWYGTVVVKGYSTVDESVTAEKTVRVKMFADAYFFVRKLMGHFGLNALWGLGIFATLVFMCKRKYLALTAPVFTLSLACLTEFLQYFTPGRFCLLSDVAIDFCGSLIGIAVAVIIFAIIFLVFRLTGKKNYERFKKVLFSIDITNVFYKTDVINSRLADDISEEITAVDKT